MERETILFDVADNVATITLNRPDSLNSFNDAMAADMTWAWETVRDTDDIHCVVLQANGERAFCTGIDIKSERPLVHEGERLEQLRPGRDAGARSSTTRCGSRWSPPCTGCAPAAAQYFLNESDIIICSDDAVFFDPHANVGIVSALEPIGMLHRGVPLGDVLRWALMGNEERITAETALRLGLVTEVVSRDALRDRAREIALVHRRAQPQGDSGDDPGHLGVAGHAAHDGPPQRGLLHADRQHHGRGQGAAEQAEDPVPLAASTRDAKRRGVRVQSANCRRQAARASGWSPCTV